MPHGPVDVALQALGRQRRIVAQVSGFATALALARASELIASVPARHTGQLRDGMHSFCPAVCRADVYCVADVASAHGRRRGASLVARMRAGGVRGFVIIRFLLLPR